MSDWEAAAKALPYGSSRKVLHCGSSQSARAYNNTNGISFHCFRCGERDFKPHGVRSAVEILKAREAERALRSAVSIPDGALRLTDQEVPPAAVLWPLVTGLTPEDASETYGMRYDPKTRRVLIPLEDGFLARSVFGERPKYIKAGAEHVESYSLLVDAQREPLVITEDILSTIKVYRAGFSAMALLGTSVSATTAARVGAFSCVISWTDGDKAGDAAFVKLRKRLGLYTTDLKRIRTDADPKELHITQIQTLIRNTT